MSKHERKWLGAWGGSLLIHAGVVGIAALVGLVMSPTSGGGGLITVEIGGPGGMAGGLGDRQHDGRKGDGGANASGADASAPGESAEAPPQSAAPKSETGEEGLAPNKTAAPPAEPQEPAPLPKASTEAASHEASDAHTLEEPNTQPAARSETEAPQEPKEDAAAPTNHEPQQEEKPAAAQKPLSQPEAVKEAVRSAADDSTQKKPKEIAEGKTAEKPLPEKREKTVRPGKKTAEKMPTKSPPVADESISKTQIPDQKHDKAKPPKTQRKNPADDRKTTTDPKRTALGSGTGTDKGPQAKKKDDGAADGKSVRQVGGAAGAAGSSGSAFSQGSDDGSGLGKGRGDLVGDGAFRDNGDGTFSARGGGGFRYRILYEEAARYPKQARTLGYDKKVAVRVRFLVGESGHVEKTIVLTKRIPKLGFEEAALRSIGKMEFEPIRLNGKAIKVWFVKTIHFSPG